MNANNAPAVDFPEQRNDEFSLDPLQIEDVLDDILSFHSPPVFRTRNLADRPTPDDWPNDIE